jgi:hypothetical protein
MPRGGVPRNRNGGRSCPHRGTRAVVIAAAAVLQANPRRESGLYPGFLLTYSRPKARMAR